MAKPLRYNRPCPVQGMCDAPATAARRRVQEVATQAATLLAATAWLAPASAAAQTDTTVRNFGTEVTNVAHVTYSTGDEEVTVVTPPAVFTIQPPATPATIEFFRFAPTASDPIMRSINGSDYSPSADLDGPFTPTGAPNTTGGQTVDLSSPIPLIPARTYLAGELMFVRVTDEGGNQDSTVIDTLVITITADNGDVITLRLYESGPDSGEFFAYLPSTAGPSDPNDNVISAGGNTQLTATYIDALDATDVVVDTAILDPLNRVFSSVTGEPVDGAEVTLINLDTGEEATVYGVDGFSTFPADTISGLSATDSSGLVYDNDTGQFRYPTLLPGRYAVRVDPPEGYTFASTMRPDQLSAEMEMDNFVILPASYGEEYLHNSTGPLRFDIPLDPVSDIVLRKTANQSFGDIGDYIGYSISIENVGLARSPITLSDTLPLGFRYVPGTARMENAAITDPNVSDDGTFLSFDAGIIDPGETITLTYALLVGPGAHLGDAVNSALVRDGNGNQVSNVARAAITLREDLLRSTSTVIGRITEQSCDGDEDWARPIDRGVGVAGVRLYMENGAYTVTDVDGLYHFEGVSEGTHVVQVDRETLPQGFELMTCEENTRYAGSNESKFIDVQGGGIWRANFYLKQTSARAEIVEKETFNDSTEYKNYDDTWIATQTADIEWVYPDTSLTPSKSATNLGIKHAPGQIIKLRLNDLEVPAYHFGGRDYNSDRSVVLSRWRGINLQDGRNVIVAEVRDEAGNLIKTLREEIWFVKTIAKAIAVPDVSTLIADGRTAPVIAIRMEDQSGRPVHKGRITRITVEPPYTLFDETGDQRLREKTENLIAPLSAQQDLQIGDDGILAVKLTPTLRTGKVTVIATLDNGREIPIYMYLEPEKRDWILVGLAEGSVAYDDVKGNAVGLNGIGGVEDTITDGRVAFFAKGLIKGDWLMTLRVDTDTRRGNRDGAFRDEIDPNAYYTLYGDRSYQEFEGQSRYPVYVKLEKRTAYATFGDYDTNITEGRLTSYNRRLSGLKAEYLGEKFQVLGFAAETNQGFQKDEIAADGTSGTYQLSQQRIIPQSEEIVVETRDRVRPDIVLERKVMVRYLDYTLDYLTGQIIFRLPVDATDTDFNPNVIVADYETSEEAERNISYGGRIQTQLADNKVTLGSTFVHEDGSELAAGAKSSQIGVDLVADITDTTQIRAEYATTRNDIEGQTDERANAMLLEVIHNSEKVSGEAYFRQEDEGFGLGQNGSNTRAARRYGLRGNIKVKTFEDEDTGRRGEQLIEAAAYREEDLTTGNERDNAELTVKHLGTRMNASVGVRATQDRLVNAENRQSILGVAQASYNIPKHDMTVQAAIETPLDGQDEVSAYPSRLTLGVDKTIGERAIVNARHEITDGANARAHNTSLGIQTTPWKGGTVTASSDLLTNDSGRRLGATVGLDQNIPLNDKWAISTGVRNRQVLDTSAEFLEVLPDAAISPFEVNQDFRSGYVGLAYRDEVTSSSTRLELRDTADKTSWIGTATVARELSEKLSVAGAARGIYDQNPGTEDTSRLDVRVGAAWRPRDEDTVVLNRFDVNHTNNGAGQKTTKLINNMALNTMVTDRWQLSSNWGVKHARTSVGDTDLSNTTHLLGAETRFDVTEHIDLGLRGSWISNSDTAGQAYSWGPSIGVSPAKNVWVSAGYNVRGFKDDDFQAAEYSREGVYLQLRLKFDQNTARGLLRRISPATTAGPGVATSQVLSQP